jgi:1-acyl-sn-glycerol-3-phosphate acyltransferase
MKAGFLMRGLAWLLVHTLYRVRLQGIRRHVPEQGAALLVCNHVSYLDALLLAAALRRPPRFVMHERVFRWPMLHWLFRAARAIPIAGASEDPRLLRLAYERIDAALSEGDLVCIFPEGSLTRDGEIARFRCGVEQILARRPVPVVPLALQGMWTSMWSRWNTRAGAGLLSRLHLPRRLRARVVIVAGAAVDGATATAAGLEARVRQLRGAMA